MNLPEIEVPQESLDFKVSLDDLYFQVWNQNGKTRIPPDIDFLVPGSYLEFDRGIQRFPLWNALYRVANKE